MRLISDWQMVPWDTPADVQRRRYGKLADDLLADPSLMAAFNGRLSLLARRGPSSAVAGEESHLHARSLGTAGAPGPTTANSEANCGNDAHTELLRRALQSSVTYGSEAFLARRSGVCMASTAEQVEGSLWLGVPLRHQP